MVFRSDSPALPLVRPRLSVAKVRGLRLPPAWTAMSQMTGRRASVAPLTRMVAQFAWLPPRIVATSSGDGGRRVNIQPGPAVTSFNNAVGVTDLPSGAPTRRAPQAAEVSAIRGRLSPRELPRMVASVLPAAWAPPATSFLGPESRPLSTLPPAAPLYRSAPAAWSEAAPRRRSVTHLEPRSERPVIAVLPSTVQPARTERIAPTAISAAEVRAWASQSPFPGVTAAAGKALGGHPSLPPGTTNSAPAANVSTTSDDAPGVNQTEIHVDGRALGQWVLSHIEHALTRPPTTANFVMSHGMPTWPGQPIFN